MKRHKSQRQAILPTRAEIKEQLRKNAADEKAINEALNGKFQQQTIGKAVAEGESFLRSHPGYGEISRKLNGMAEALNDVPAVAQSPADRILTGIEFRTKNGRGLVAQRINLELESAVYQEYSRLERQWDETEKRLHVQIEKLRDALRLEQARHFTDIDNFACGSSVMGFAGERRG